MRATIRLATLDDTGAIAAILRELGWFSHIDNESVAETEARVARHFELCSADDSHTVLVAEDGRGEVTGYAAVHWLPYLMLAGPEGYVSELFVRQGARGQGVGRRLLEAVRQRAVERGCTRLMLVNLQSRESYKRGFYTKAGWSERLEVSNFVLPLP